MRKVFNSLLIIGWLTSGVHFVSAESKTTESDATSIYMQGKKLYDQKQYSKAYPFFKEAAEKGNSDAMMHLGKMFYNGWGVIHNHDTGREWHEKAAKRGNKESIEKLKKMDMHH